MSGIDDIAKSRWLRQLGMIYPTARHRAWNGRILILDPRDFREVSPNEKTDRFSHLYADVRHVFLTSGTFGIFHIHPGGISAVGFAFGSIALSGFRKSLSYGFQKRIQSGPMVRVFGNRLVNRCRGVFIPGNRISRGRCFAFVARFFRCRGSVLLRVRVR